MFCFNSISRPNLNCSCSRCQRNMLMFSEVKLSYITIKKLEPGKYIKAINSVPCYSPDFDDKDIMKMKTL